MHYPAQAIAPDSITVQGRGWGHGRGLQQWGALGYAIDHFWSYEQILQHYYSNTTSGYVSDREIKVHITRNNEMDLLVTSANPFIVQVFSSTAGKLRGCLRTGPRALIFDNPVAALTRATPYMTVILASLMPVGAPISKPTL